MALNITLQTYADTMNLGFVGCRDRLPHLQRLAVYTGDALAALEKAMSDETGAEGFRDLNARFAPLVMEGRREIYRIVE